jgi:hypothetical protein
MWAIFRLVIIRTIPMRRRIMNELLPPFCGAPGGSVTSGRRGFTMNGNRTSIRE